MPLFFLLAAYLIGSIPSGLLLARTMGIDVRRSGSGNIGATNVTRLAGKRLGILTLLADMIKGIVPMLLARQLLGGQEEMQSWVILCGIAAFLGHLFPLYLKFRGGKGVATAMGIFLVMQPLAVLFCLAVFATVVKLFGYVSLGSLTAAALMPVFVWLLGGESSTLMAATVIALLIWLRHRDNIARLLRGQEKSWKG
jgi:glycerol-3-phosphate acyltransferase PlsY